MPGQAPRRHAPCQAKRHAASHAIRTAVPLFAAWHPDTRYPHPPVSRTSRHRLLVSATAPRQLMACGGYKRVRLCCSWLLTLATYYAVARLCCSWPRPSSMIRAQTPRPTCKRTSVPRPPSPRICTTRHARSMPRTCTSTCHAHAHAQAMHMHMRRPCTCHAHTSPGDEDGGVYIYIYTRG